MILVDFNQIVISSLMSQLNRDPSLSVQEDLVRHIILSSVLRIKRKFSQDYGELILTLDDKNYWRKKVFPYYKAHRKSWREDSKYDWSEIFDCINKIKAEVKEVFPYKVLQIDTAEADDIISVMTKYAHGYEKIVVVSADKDFIQLQKYKNVVQYCPITNKFIRHSNPEKYLKEHIIRGDRGDGVPNFLSADDTFATGKRQRRIMSKKLEIWLKMDPQDFCLDETQRRNYSRNDSLINLENVPENIKNEIINSYETYVNNDKSKLFDYFVKHRLKNLMGDIHDF